MKFTSLALILLRQLILFSLSAPDLARADCRAPGPSNPIPALSKGVTRYVAPNGTGSGSTPTDAMSLQAALTVAQPGDVVILADGIYYLQGPTASSARITFGPAGTGPDNMTVYKAADCARPIITTKGGNPPDVFMSDYLRLDGLWIGGQRVACFDASPPCPGGNGIFTGSNPAGLYRQIVNSTIFGYYGGIEQGSTERSLYQGNRFVNDGGGTFAHAIYASGGYPTTPNVDGGWLVQHTIIDGNIFVGDQGYSIHFWHHNHSNITTRNFVGLSQWGEVMDGSDGLSANNFYYGNQWLGYYPGNHRIIINNLFGDNNGSGVTSDYSNSLFPGTDVLDRNAFLVTPTHANVGGPPYGDNYVLLTSSLAENQAGIPTAALSAAMRSIKQSFQGPVETLLTDLSIEPAFAKLRLAIPPGSPLYHSGRPWLGGSAPNLGPDTPAPSSVDGFWSVFHNLGLHDFNRWGDMITIPPVSTVRGNWRGNFGADGYIIANDQTQLPAYATVSFNPLASMLTNSGLCNTSSTTDVRGLQRASRPTSRIVSCWQSAPVTPPALLSLTLDINLTDGRPHKVSFYLLDFWASQLSSGIQVLDPSTGAVLRSRFLPEGSFMGGQYVSWDLSGHVLVRFTDPSRAQSGTVLSAVFFDPPSAPSPVPAPDTTPP